MILNVTWNNKICEKSQETFLKEKLLRGQGKTPPSEYKNIY